MVSTNYRCSEDLSADIGYISLGLLSIEGSLHMGGTVDYRFNETISSKMTSVNRKPNHSVMDKAMSWTKLLLF